MLIWEVVYCGLLDGMWDERVVEGRVVGAKRWDVARWGDGDDDGGGGDGEYVVGLMLWKWSW